MKKEKINNIQLQRLVALKCNKLDFEDVTDDDLYKIQEITIQGKLINGRMSGIDLESIQIFPNLIRLAISDFEIKRQFIQDLVQLKKLKILEFIRCSFEEVDFGQIEENVSDIRFTGCKSLNFRYPKIKSINITGSEIDFEKIDFSTVEYINIIESNIKNVCDLTQFSNITRVNLDASILIGKGGEILQDIKVPEGTQYTHALEIRAMDPR